MSLTNSQPDDVGGYAEGLSPHAKITAGLALSQSLDHVKEDLKQHDGGTVIEKALPFHQDTEPFRGSGCTAETCVAACKPHGTFHGLLSGCEEQNGHSSICILPKCTLFKHHKRMRDRADLSSGWQTPPQRQWMRSWRRRGPHAPRASPPSSDQRHTTAGVCTWPCLQ